MSTSPGNVRGGDGLTDGDKSLTRSREGACTSVQISQVSAASDVFLRLPSSLSDVSDAHPPELMQYQRQPRIRAVKKLLGGSEDAKEQEETEEEAREKDGAMPIVA